MSFELGNVYIQGPDGEMKPFESGGKFEFALAGDPGATFEVPTSFTAEISSGTINPAFLAILAPPIEPRFAMRVDSPRYQLYQPPRCLRRGSPAAWRRWGLLSITYPEVRLVP
jgi:hypothetical protein